MTKLIIGGVPEHFNLPWHISLQQNVFTKEGISLEWKDFPGGTGAMCQSLRNGEIDLAVLLTEGIIADIMNGNPSKILQWYVLSPLIWGIHVAAHSHISSVSEIRSKKFAISRRGSGSHLMAYVDAFNRNFPISENQFVPVGDIEGAVKALLDNEADVFLWEKFMTQPYVDKNIFRRVGEVPTPWPCFAIAAGEKALVEKPEAIIKVLEIVNKSFNQMMKENGSAERVSQKYQLLLSDAQNWLHNTYWSNSSEIKKQTLDHVIEVLSRLGLIKESRPVAEIISPFTVLK